MKHLFFTLEPLAKWVPSHFVAQGAIPRASISDLCRRLGGGMEINMKKDFFTKATVLNGQIAIFYLGQTGFILKYKDKYILIDGYLSDYVDKNCSSELVKWVRNYPAPVDAKELDFVDYVFCTHAHFDHADPYMLKDIASVNKKAKFYVSKAIEDVILSYGIEKERIIGLCCDKKTALNEDIFVTAIPSAHEELHEDENGDFFEVGFRFELGEISVFNGGDGCPYDGLSERLNGCDVLMLPINGRDHYRRYVCDIIGNFESHEVLQLAKDIGADLVIPTHFDLYSVNCVDPSEFTDKLNEINPEQKYHIFTPGEMFLYKK